MSINRQYATAGIGRRMAKSLWHHQIGCAVSNVPLDSGQHKTRNHKRLYVHADLWKRAVHEDSRPDRICLCYRPLPACPQFCGVIHKRISGNLRLSFLLRPREPFALRSQGRESRDSVGRLSCCTHHRTLRPLQSPAILSARRRPSRTWPATRFFRWC